MSFGRNCRKFARLRSWCAPDIAALNNGSTDVDFAELTKGAEEAWPVLQQALKTKKASKVIVLKTPTEYCPRHQIGLPTGEVAKLHSLGIGVAKHSLRFCSSLAGRLIWRDFHFGNSTARSRGQ